MTLQVIVSGPDKQQQCFRARFSAMCHSMETLPGIEHAGICCVPALTPNQSQHVQFAMQSSTCRNKQARAQAGNTGFCEQSSSLLSSQCAAGFGCQTESHTTHHVDNTGVHAEQLAAVSSIEVSRGIRLDPMLLYACKIHRQSS